MEFFCKVRTCHLNVTVVFEMQEIFKQMQIVVDFFRQNTLHLLPSR